MEDFEDSRRMVCDRCRKSVPISDIKYVPKGIGSRQALCSNCRSTPVEAKPANLFKKIISSAPEKPIQKTVLSTVKAKVAATKDDLGKKTFFCARCKFKFKHDPFGVTNLKCPYCGKSDKVTANTGSADLYIQTANPK